MMVATVAAAALLAPAYKSVLVASQKPSFWRGVIACTVLTNKETVAGYICPSPGNHGETFNSQPYVWSKGKLTRLPLLKNGMYGKVLAGRDDLLVGSVSINYSDFPVQWTPDPVKGWAAAKVTRLSNNQGEGAALSSDGTVWVEKDSVLIAKIQGSKWKNCSYGQFDLKGIDNLGRIFGNKFSKVYFGGDPADTEAGWFLGIRWNRLSKGRAASYYGSSEIIAVNSSGVAVGKGRNNQLAIWKGADIYHPLSEELRWSYATDINSKGVVLGRCSVEDVESSATFLLINGKGQNLNQYLPGFEISSAEKLNDSGTVAVQARKGEMEYLYLLRPVATLSTK